MLNTDPDRISVAAGIVFDENKRVLVGKRTPPCTYADLWEFPGGKILPSELVSEALARELREEVGILVKTSIPFVKFPYDYDKRKVFLNFRLVFEYDGIPKPLEQQDLQWINIPQLSKFEFLAPNARVIEMLQLASF